MEDVNPYFIAVDAKQECLNYIITIRSKARSQLLTNLNRRSRNRLARWIYQLCWIEIRAEGLDPSPEKLDDFYNALWNVRWELCDHVNCCEFELEQIVSLEEI